MNISAFFKQFIDVVPNVSEYSHQVISEELIKRDVPNDEAGKVYAFSLLACGRNYLKDDNIYFSNQYLGFSSKGEVVERGNIDESEYFIAASRMLNPQTLTAKAFKNIAKLSADVQSVSEAKKAGAQMEGLQTAPAFMFFELPTTEGAKKAQLVIQAYMTKLLEEQEEAEKLMSKSRPKKNKPRWKFWG